MRGFLQISAINFADFFSWETTNLGSLKYAIKTLGYWNLPGQVLASNITILCIVYGNNWSPSDFDKIGKQMLFDMKPSTIVEDKANSQFWKFQLNRWNFYPIFSILMFYEPVHINKPRPTPTETAQSRSSDFVQFNTCFRGKSSKNCDESRLKKYCSVVEIFVLFWRHYLQKRSFFVIFSDIDISSMVFAI